MNAALQLSVIREAIKAVPAVKYALAIGGIVAVISLIPLFHLDYRVAVIGTILMFVLMTVMVIFAQMVSVASQFRLPVLVLTWFSLLLFISTASALFLSVFFKWPQDLQGWVASSKGSDPRLEKNGSDGKSDIVPKQTITPSSPKNASPRERIADEANSDIGPKKGPAPFVRRNDAPVPIRSTKNVEVSNDQRQITIPSPSPAPTPNPLIVCPDHAANKELVLREIYDVGESDVQQLSIYYLRIMRIPSGELSRMQLLTALRSQVCNADDKRLTEIKDAVHH